MLGMMNISKTYGISQLMNVTGGGKFWFSGVENNMFGTEAFSFEHFMAGQPTPKVPPPEIRV